VKHSFQDCKAKKVQFFQTHPWRACLRRASLLVPNENDLPHPVPHWGMGEPLINAVGNAERRTVWGK
jgi:hypothetical protein